MGWLEALDPRALRRGLGHGRGDSAAAAARVSVLGASLDDADRARDLPPPPVAGWRHEGGAWVRWSELDGAYREAPIPMSLRTYLNTIGTPREGLTVALVDGGWREVTSGAEPLQLPIGEQPAAPAQVRPRAVDPPGPPTAGPHRMELATATPAPGPAPAQERADAPSTVAEQLAAWRRRKGGPST